MNSRSKVPDDINELLRLVRAGKLFAIQEWIKAGNALRVADSDERPSSVICAAAGTGLHSLVEELLRAGAWSSSELADALETARSSKHFEVAALLEHHGAYPKPLDFQTSCENLDLFMMERHLRTGTDPNSDNVFARTLSSVKARPLLGFYRQFRTEFPALDDQAALALAEAVKERQVRWTALLAWAGADPFRRVPNSLSEPFPVDPENCTTAAKEAVWCSHPEILKALHLKPTPAQALELLSDATFFGNFKLFQNLLSIVPRDQINHAPRGSSQALENLVSRWAHRDLYNNTRDSKGDAENLQCLELLLDSGARWNPTPEELRHVRRNLLGHEGRYIVQVLRLLVYTPNAANTESLLELCRSQTLEAKITSADAPFVSEIRALRKSHHSLNAGDASTNGETAPAELKH